MTAPLWTPDPDRIARSNLRAFTEHLRRAGAWHGADAHGVDYAALYEWSIAEPARFWSELWRFCDVIAEPRDRRPAGDPWDDVVVGLERMAPSDPVLGPRWFTGARLNFAEHLLRYRDDREALVCWTERGRQRALTYAELAAEVARVREAFSAWGVGAGDRVVGFLPNIPEAVIAMLAAASLGAIWSSCSPDFGVKGVLDRFGQIAPRVLVCADGYRYAGKEIDCLPRVRDVAAAIPSIEHVVVVGYLRADAELSGVRDAVRWEDLGTAVTDDGAIAADGLPAREFVRLPFDHPLYIMYSSGTTGLPKCMVHSAGGTLVQHLKEHVLHGDLTRSDTLFYFTTCGWMMWNWLVSALAVGARLVLYDGAPLAPAADSLWSMAEREGVTVFGTSAKYLALCEKEGLAPGRTHDLSRLRAILSTGSPLAPPSFDWVYGSVKRDVQLASISGGTDIISCFALGDPTGPVWRGEIQARGLGMKVEVFSSEGRAIVGEPGELVCTMPFPSMPVRFWNDPDGAAYRAAYFSDFPGAWRHGDWAELTQHGGLIITGRSDATLNPGGVRIGTAEIYRQVEQLPEILESIVIGQDVSEGGAIDVRIVLFVKLRAGLVLDDALRERIRRAIREQTSPHHVPRVIVQVADIPRTISGKITEIAVREIVHGRPVRNADALANPESLELFRAIPELAGKLQ